MASKKRAEDESMDAQPAAGTSTPQQASSPSPAPPDSEVSERPSRRSFSAEYKLGILREADACTAPGQVGALLRREGLYSSHLVTWRAQREQGQLEALSAKKRGRKAKPVNPLSTRVNELERENAKLRKQLKQAETIIEVQKKVSEILAPLETPEDGNE